MCGMGAPALETAVDDGPTRAGAPQRRCLVTRRIADKGSLIRFVLGPGDAVLADVAGTLPGRGVWLSPERDVVDAACAKNLFARGFRTPVTVEADLADRIEQLLARRCLDLLGLARRAGVAGAGFEKVQAMLAGITCGALVIAADAGADGRRRLGRMVPEVPVVTLFAAAELAAALGREHVVYVALKEGRLAARFIAETARLAGFRAGGEARRGAGRNAPGGRQGMRKAQQVR